MPTLLERLGLRRTQSVERAFAPPPHVGVEQRTGISEPTQPQPAQLLLEVKSWQGMASRAIAKSIGRLVPRVFTESRTGPGTVEQIELDDHPLKRLLDRPNPFLSRNQLHRLVSMWLTQVGDGYLLKVTDGLGVVVELWPLPPHRIEQVWNPQQGLVGYVYHAKTGQEIPYQREELVRFWDPDPIEPFAAMGNLGPQATQYDAASFIDQTVREHYREDAAPKAALVSGEGASPPPELGTDDFERWVRAWRQTWHQRSGTYKGVPVPLPIGVDLKEMTNAAATQDPEVAAFYRDQILMANGVPRSILGDVVDANRAAAETNRFVFESETLQPIAELMADAYTIQLAAVNFDSRLMVGWQDYVTSDKQHELSVERQDLELKVRSIDQVRAARGEEPVSWGEDPVGSLGDRPYRPDEQAADPFGNPNPFAPSGADGPEDDDSDAAPPAQDDVDERSRAHTVGFQRAFFGVQEHVLQAFLAEGRRGMVRVFTAQRKTLADLVTSVSRSHQRQVPDELQELIDAALEDPKWATLFGREFEQLRRQAMQLVGQFSVEQLPTGQSWTFSEQVAAAMEDQGSVMLQQVNGTTRTRLGRTLAEGLAAGEDEQALATRVRKVFRGRTEVDAETIARTELLRATQTAQVEGFRQSGVVDRKRWNHVTGGHGDPGAREMHVQLDGIAVPLQAVFEFSDGVMAEAPGVGVGGPLPAHHAINCRCFITPVVG